MSFNYVHIEKKCIVLNVKDRKQNRIEKANPA